MNDTTPIIIFIIVVNTIAFMLMMVGVHFFQRRGSFNAGNKRNALGNQLEQRLVFEAISACALEPEFKDVIQAIGSNAAEKTGFAEWILWLRQENRDFYIADAHGKSFTFSEVKHSGANDLYTWVLQNLEPMELGKFVQDMVEDENLKRALINMDEGLLIPFLDGQHLLGFIVLGGKKDSTEGRSTDFLSLFGAFAAIIIKKSRADEMQSHLFKEQLRADSLANLGKLAAGMAHEIRNPLTFMKAAVQQLQKKYTFADKDQGLTEGIVEEIDRINQHVEDLLVLGKIDPVEFEITSLNPILEKAVKLISSQAKEKGIECSLSLAEEELKFLGNEDLIWQIVLNLILNAMEAMQSRGSLTLSCCTREDDICLEVKDSGQGIPEAIADKIFDPFFTTKDHGTGLGLSTSYNVALAHNGTLSLIDSNTDGTTFRLLLPLTSRGNEQNEK